MGFIIIIILIVIYLIIIKILCENFIDLKNIPKNYGDDIKDINISPETGVPKIIHHICPKDFRKWHHKWFFCYESWIKIFPADKYTHMHWFDDELEEIIDNDGFEWFLPIFRAYDVHIKRIDMVRPFILYTYGGVFADMDIEVYKDFFDQLSPDKVSIVESPYKGNEEISNCLMASPPKHNFWLLIIDRCYQYRDKYTLLATGPQLISEIYRENSQIVHVLPDILFNPAPWFAENKDIYTKHFNTVMWDGTK